MGGRQTLSEFMVASRAADIFEVLKRVVCAKYMATM